MPLSWGVLSLASLGAGRLPAMLGPIGSVLVLAADSLIVALAATAGPAVRHAPPLPVRPVRSASTSRWCPPRDQGHGSDVSDSSEVRVASP
ncbi:hypothetical protein [Streptomyces europaeiscabiei]|uniref:hypothetical protein n=1 Tax=Streptomyces europaeiscabiei TaxID=146819 RepID=UPI0029A55EAB|nr:hypothetical protein [Streptomyces europaeiscabiei]MDX3846696.1 hypothetical protein [Streptomyces europaeiscabiei]